MVHGGDPLLSGTRYIIAVFLLLEPASCSDEVYQSMLDNVDAGDHDGWGLGWSSQEEGMKREGEGEKGRDDEIEIGVGDVEVNAVGAMREKREQDTRALQRRRNGDNGGKWQGERGQSQGLKGEERREERGGREGGEMEHEDEDDAVSALMDAFLPFYSRDPSFSTSLPFPLHGQKDIRIDADTDMNIEEKPSVFNPAAGQLSFSFGFDNFN